VSHHSAAGKIGSHASWARTADRSARTAPGRRAFMERFYDEVDPERVLPEAERELRAQSARKAYFSRLAMKSAKARRRKAETAA
jgi:hypothetical protein